MTEFLNFFNKKVTKLKSEIIAQDTKLIENVVSKETFLQSSKQVSCRKLDIDEQQLNMLQNYLKSEGINENPPVKLEIDNFIGKFGELFDDSVKIVKNGVTLESTDPNVPKVSRQIMQILHWFEWNKKKLYIYDVLTNNSAIIDLQINFKIPSYSRSVLTPVGHIYLLGGEEPELVTRDDVYMYDCTAGAGNCALQVKVTSTQQAKMLYKKYDFTCCVLDNFIYVISGRDSTSDIVDRCERYDYVKDAWYSIAPVKRKRYAASSASLAGLKKIFLFGGRSDSNNNMLEDIEEYDVSRDEWNLVTLRDPSVWVPVEVSAMIQIEEDKLLVFGGSDSRVKDTANSYIFNATDYSLEKTDDLKRPQVFVAGPVCFGRKIYAIGNEYYVKNRSLNRFHIDRREWSIIF